MGFLDEHEPLWAKMQEEPDLVPHPPDCAVCADPRRSMETLKAQPLHDRVIVRRMELEAEVKVGSIHIPTMAQEPPTSGIVLAIGNGRILADGSIRALDLKVGDRVLFGKYSGTPVALQEHTVEEQKGVIILREDEILVRE